MPGFLGDLAEDEAVGGGDDEQGQAVESDDVEEVVGQLVHWGREEVESHALREPPVCGVALHVEYHALYDRQQSLVQQMSQSVQQWNIMLCTTDNNHWFGG